MSSVHTMRTTCNKHCSQYNMYCTYKPTTNSDRVPSQEQPSAWLEQITLKLKISLRTKRSGKNWNEKEYIPLIHSCLLVTERVQGTTTRPIKQKPEEYKDTHTTLKRDTLDYRGSTLKAGWACFDVLAHTFKLAEATISHNCIAECTWYILNMYLQCKALRIQHL